MNKNEIFAALAPVDIYSQLSCLGSMQYTVTAEAIRGAMKLIPDHPTPEGMEAFFNEERNRKLDLTYAGPDEHGELVPLTRVSDVNTTPGNYYEERRTLAALLDLRQDILDMSDELAANTNGTEQEERTLFNTMQFMATQQRVDPAFFAKQYTANMRLGMKNYGQTRTEYVQQEVTRAAEQAERFAAKGEHAVQFLEGLDPIEGPVAERTMEALAKRCVAKLIARRIKIGQTLSWRSDPEQRAEAEADILFIEHAIVALDGEVPTEIVTPAEAENDMTEAPKLHTGVDIDALIAILQANRTQNPKAPGPVTIIKH